MLGLLWLGWAVGPNVTRLQAADGAGAPVTTAVEGVSWQPWSAERQAALLAEGRPVFVDFTAAWCVTCQYNKRTTLADAEVLADMAGEHGAAARRLDPPRPDMTAALASLGRNGVPVYAIYRNGQAPQLLSEVLSVDEVRSALAGL